MTVSSELLALREAITTADQAEPLLRVELPLTTVSEANAHEHWRAKAKRAKSQRDAVANRLRPFPRSIGEDFLLCASGALYAGGLVVLLTRVAPRSLDSDNLSRSLKACRDGVADALGIDDRDPRVTWLVDQRKGPAAVVVEIFRRTT